MTTRRCRIGDLAVIVSADIPQNVGRFVDVLREADPYKGDATWWIRMRNGPGLRRDGWKDEGRIRDKCLQPIRGKDGESLRRMDKETVVPTVRA